MKYLDNADGHGYRRISLSGPRAIVTEVASYRAMSDTVERLKAALADRYAIEHELGAGGMATVYLAEDLKHHRKVAVKVLRPELAATIGSERFLREIEIAARLNHPHILPLHDSGEAGGFLYYVMPYETGQSLRERLTAEGELPVADAVRVLRDIVDALAHAHAQGVVHRDIKPDNVMLSGRHALVTDFGVAKAVTEATGRHELTTVGVALGTPAYMAPEQAAADPHIDHRADIYAVGALAYELLTGGVPFTGSTAQAILSAHLTEAPEPVSKRRDNIPPALAQLVMKCLEKEPGRRFQTADELLSQIDSFVTPSSGVRAAVRSAVLPKIQAHRLAFSGLAVVIVALAVGALFLTARRRAALQWARDEALPEIARLADAGEVEAAYRLATRAQAVIPTDSALSSLWPLFSRIGSFRTEPTGATVYRKPYAAADGEWELLGTSPIDSIQVPRQFFRLRFEIDGYRTLDVAATSGEIAAGRLFVLNHAGNTPDNMVRVPGGEFTIQSAGFEHLDAVRVDDYLIGKHEVINREFKQFVAAGGYRSSQYWEHDVIQDGRRVSFEEAMDLFRDRTGRPGPSTWEAGDFPTGEEDYPVAGVSWYEAAAYARFVGKQLPTIYQWNKAAATARAAWIAPLSNYDDRGVAPVGSYEGIGPYGTFDMAGNVREWCVNATGDRRFILGGGWNDEAYTFVEAYSQLPLDRSPTNGFRVAEYLGDDESLTVASRPIDLPFRDFSTERPASDAEFAIFLRMYAYDATPLNASIEEESRTNEWTRQRITFDAAYGTERMMAYLWLPTSGDGPFQTVVHFPGGGAIFRRSIDEFGTRTFDFILKSGRAFMLPIYKGTYERGDDLDTDMPNESNAYKSRVAQWGKDLRRSVDYLETREDIAADSLAYYGLSWGGRMGGLMVAIEPRFETAILYVAGLKFQRAQPEADPFNFVPHITMPVLMLNGSLDHYFPLETSQKPMFRLLGTPPEDKRHVVEDGGHFVPRARLITEVLDWLDRYLGPVR